MRRGRTWPWIRMRPFLARFSEPVWSGHLASRADFITTTPELEFSVNTANVLRLIVNNAIKTEFIPKPIAFGFTASGSDHPASLDPGYLAGHAVGQGAA